MTLIRNIQGWKAVDSTGTAHDVIDARVGADRVWPVVENVVLHYSGGYSHILASGANYAWITATVNGVANVTLTPVLDAASSAFYVDGNHIRAYSRGTTVGEVRSINAHATYLLVQTASVSVSQQANVRESLVITSEDITVTFDDADLPSIPCSQTVLNAYAHITRHLESTYTSGAVAQTMDHLGDIDIWYNGAKAGTVTDGGYYAVNVGGNNHNLSARTVTITAYSGRWSGSASTEQDPDTYRQTGTTSSDYFSDISTSTNSIGPAGGSATLEPTAYHKETPVYTWDSDGATFNGQPVIVEDTPVITGSASHFSRSGMTVTHENMGTRLETDSVTYTVTNGDATASIQFYATNTRSVKKAAFDTTTGFGISLSTISVPCTGGTITVSGTEIYTHTNTLYQYTSGATSGGESSAGLTRAATPTVTANQDATVSGVRVTIPARVQNTQQTTYTITGTWGGYTDSEEADRQGDTYTATVENYDYWAELTTTSSTIGAAGGTATLEALAGHRRRTKYAWASGGTTYSGVTDITDSVTISGSANHFSRSGNTVTHDNMGTREGTDSVTYTATNNSKTTVTATFEISATNTKSVKTAAHDTTTGFYIVPSATSVACTGGTVTITGKEVYTHYDTLYQYTSGSTSGGAATAGLTRDVTPTVSVDLDATVSGVRVTIPARIQNANPTVYTVTGRWSTYTDTEEVDRLGDTYTSAVENYDYWVELTTTQSNISAAGGTATLEATAGHSRRTRYDWATGGTTYSAVTSITDTATISGSASHFSRSGNTVTHDNMGTRLETDSVTYTAKNTAHTSTTDTFTLSATNTRSVKTAAFDTTTGFRIATSAISVPCTGGTITVSGYEIYTHTDTLYQYTSGSTSGGASTAGLERSATPTVSVTGDATVSGTTITIPARIQNAQQTTYTVTGTWSGRTDSEEVDRLGDTYTATVQNYDYWVELTTTSSTISASGGTATLEALAGHRRRTKYDWATGGTTYSAVTDIEDTPVITGSASHFTRSGMTVTHENMGTRTGTDSVTYTATNNGVTDTFTISATNSAGTPSVTNVALQLDVESEIDCTDSAFHVTGYITRTLSTPYTSGATSASTDHAGTMTVTQNGTSKGTITNGGQLTLNVGTNKHTTSSRSFTLALKYGTYTTSRTVLQAEDSKYSTAVAGPVSITAELETSTITAGGGSAVVGVTCGRNTTRTWYWASDDAATGESTTVWTQGDFTFSPASSGRFTVTKDSNNHLLNIAHASMGTNIATDTLSVTVTAVDDSTKSATVAVASVQNKIESTTPETTEITDVWFNFYPDHFESAGGTTELFLTIFTTTTYTKYTYTSGATSGGSQSTHEEDVDPTSIRSLVSWCYANSNTMLTANRNYSGSSRTAQIEAVWGGVTYTGEITQY